MINGETVRRKLESPSNRIAQAARGRGERFGAAERVLSHRGLPRADRGTSGRRSLRISQQGARSASGAGKTWSGRCSTARNFCCGIDGLLTAREGVIGEVGRRSRCRKVALNSCRPAACHAGVCFRRARPESPGSRLPSLLRAEQSRRVERARAKHIILLASVRRSVAPRHIRHEAGARPMASAASSSRSRPVSRACRSSEHLPRFATVIDRFAQVRSVNHRMKNHNSATYYSLTGHAPPVDDIRLRDTQELYPAYGSTVAKLKPVEDPSVPTFVSYPYVLRDGSVTPGQHASFLGKAFDPFFIARDPNQSSFRLPELSLPVVVAAIATRRPARLAAVDRPPDRSIELVRDGPRDRCVLHAGTDDARLAQGQASVRSHGRARPPSRPVRANELRPELPAGAPAGRGRRAIRVRLLLGVDRRQGRAAAGIRTATISTSSRTGCCRSPTRPCRP